jgi:hypothetical protein
MSYSAGMRFGPWPVSPKGIGGTLYLHLIVDSPAASTDGLVLDILYLTN